MSKSRSTTAVSWPVSLGDRTGQVGREERLAGPSLGGEDRHDAALLGLDALRSDRRSPSAGSTPTRSRVRRRRGAPRLPASCRPRPGCPPASRRAAGRSTCGRGPARSPSPVPGVRRTQRGPARRAPSPPATGRGPRPELNAWIRSSSAAVADCTHPSLLGLDLERTCQLLTEGLRRADGDDGGLVHRFTIATKPRAAIAATTSMRTITRPCELIVPRSFLTLQPARAEPARGGIRQAMSLTRRPFPMLRSSTCPVGALSPKHPGDPCSAACAAGPIGPAAAREARRSLEPPSM